jgi:hypothetical protein
LNSYSRSQGIKIYITAAQQRFGETPSGEIAREEIKKKIE